MTMTALQAAVMNDALALDQERLTRFCQDRRIKKLALFGSRLEKTHRANSDVDLLVEFEAGATPTLLDMSDMESELSLMLGGLPVDLRTEQELSRYFRDEVLLKAEVQFAAP